MKRYKELDALRGIAAVTVVFNHFIIILGHIPSFLYFFPFIFLWAGHEAVIFFFVLSGFVLSLHFYTKNVEQYRTFILKRIFRVYVPYLSAILLAIGTYMLFAPYNSNAQDLSMWYYNTWHTPLSLSLLWQHIFLIGDFKNTTLDPVIWSLVHEMRISLIFPFLMVLVIKFPWKIIVTFCLSLGIITVSLDFFSYHFFHKSFDYIDTIVYISCFLAGALIAKHQEYIKKYSEVHLIKKLAWLCVGVAFYGYSHLFDNIFTNLHHGHFVSFVLTTWGITIGVTIFISLTITQDKVKVILSKNVFQFLGKISYSLYLYHVIVLLSLFHLLFEKISLIIIYPIAFIVSLLLATVGYRWIENPAIEIGRKITSSFPNSKNIYVTMKE